MIKNFDFKEDIEPIFSSDLPYDLNNGYIKLEKVLSSQEQIDALRNAMELLNRFEEELRKAEILIDI